MKKKSRRIILIVLGILILASLSTFIYLYSTNKNKNEEEIQNNKKPIYKDVIEGYGYTLEDRDTILFEEIYLELKQTLTQNEINYDEYAKLLSKLYIVDVYTIENKVNKYDLGGTEYVYPEIKENFELKLGDTLYKYVVDNSEGKRIQELPEIEKISVTDIKHSKYTYLEKKYESYEVQLEWTYVKDLEYDKTATIILIKEDSKIFIAEQK